MTSSKDNTIPSCMHHCRRNGYTYAGLFNGFGCSCANDYPHELSDCYNNRLKKCTGDKTTVCGGAPQRSRTSPGSVRTSASVYRVCVPGKYGSTCEKQCPSECGGKGCHMNGACLEECPAGYRINGGICTKGCDSGTFGPDCQHTCGFFKCKNEKCHPKVGFCTDGCIASNLYGPYCRLATVNTSNNPAGKCPFCAHCQDSKCIGKGRAYHGCAKNWRGNTCKATGSAAQASGQKASDLSNASSHPKQSVLGFGMLIMFARNM